MWRVNRIIYTAAPIPQAGYRKLLVLYEWKFTSERVRANAESWEWDAQNISESPAGWLADRLHDDYWPISFLTLCKKLRCETLEKMRFCSKSMCAHELSNSLYLPRPWWKKIIRKKKDSACLRLSGDSRPIFCAQLCWRQRSYSYIQIHGHCVAGLKWFHCERV